jgi:hypothetical protein
MSAPKGNKYALGNDGGAPTKLTEEMMERIRTYLARHAGDTIDRINFTKDGRVDVPVPIPPSINGLSVDIGITRETLYQWGKINQEISDTLRKITAKYEEILKENGLSDRYNAGFAKFLLSCDHNKREKTDVTSDGKPMPTPILNGQANVYGDNSDKKNSETQEKD